MELSDEEIAGIMSLLRKMTAAVQHVSNLTDSI